MPAKVVWQNCRVFERQTTGDSGPQFIERSNLADVTVNPAVKSFVTSAYPPSAWETENLIRS